MDPSNPMMSQSPTERHQLRPPHGQAQQNNNRKQVLKIGNEQTARNQTGGGVDSPQKKSFDEYYQRNERGQTQQKQGLDQRSDDLMSVFNSRMINQDDAEIEKIIAKEQQEVNKMDLDKLSSAIDGLGKF